MVTIATGKPEAPFRILITGASGGLGEALARHYAGTGRHIALWGRKINRLQEVSEMCRKAGATASIRSLDLSDGNAAIAALRDEDIESPLDLAIFCAGLGDIQTATDLAEDPQQVARLGLINFVAPAAMAAAIAQRMASRRSGRIVLIGSAASFHALPFAAAYAGSKAGLTRFAEALRIGVAPHGVRVTLISPGFIDTAAGRKVAGPKPFLMDGDVVAARIAFASERGVAHLVLPAPFIALRWLDRLLPRSLRDRLLLSLAPTE